MPIRHYALCGILAVFTLATTGSAVVRSQEKGLEALKSDLDGKYRTILKDLLRGDVEADPKNPEHVAAISTETEYLARRFVDPLFLNTPPNPPDRDREKTLTYLIGRVDIDLNEMARSKKNIQPVASLYTHYFGLHAKAVIQGRAKAIPVAALNLARALANVSVLGQGELSEALVDLIEADLKKDALPEAERLRTPENLPNDGVKYYALRGLQRLLEQTPKPPADSILTKEQEAKVVKLMTKLITTSQAFKDGTPQQEIDGFRVRRREAIKVLALTPNPTVPDKKDGTAMTLLRVVARDSKLEPVPSMDERVEAAIGLARMKLEQAKDYDADYAAYHIGLFLDELVTYCNSPEGNPTYQRPVRVWASRLIEALESMRTQLDDPEIKRTAAEKQFVTDALKQYYGEVLTRLEKAADGRISPTTYKLNSWLAAAKPPNMTLFKGAADTAVEPPKKKE
jgi:hypothetical protein